MVMATRIVAHKGVLELKTAVVPEAGWQVWKGSVWDFIGILTLDLASRTMERISFSCPKPPSFWALTQGK